MKTIYLSSLQHLNRGARRKLPKVMTRRSLSQQGLEPPVSGQRHGRAVSPRAACLSAPVPRPCRLAAEARPRCGGCGAGRPPRDRAPLDTARDVTGRRWRRGQSRGVGASGRHRSSRAGCSGVRRCPLMPVLTMYVVGIYAKCRRVRMLS